MKRSADSAPQYLLDLRTTFSPDIIDDRDDKRSDLFGSKESYFEDTNTPTLGNCYDHKQERSATYLSYFEDATSDTLFFLL